MTGLISSRLHMFNQQSRNYILLHFDFRLIGGLVGNILGFVAFGLLKLDSI
jgi:hypothetical protein